MRHYQGRLSIYRLYMLNSALTIRQHVFVALFLNKATKTVQNLTLGYKNMLSYG